MTLSRFASNFELAVDKMSPPEDPQNAIAPSGSTAAARTDSLTTNEVADQIDASSSSQPARKVDEDSDEEDDEGFVYPAESTVTKEEEAKKDEEEVHEDHEEEFVYPSQPESPKLPESVIPAQEEPEREPTPEPEPTSQQEVEEEPLQETPAQTRSSTPEPEDNIAPPVVQEQPASTRQPKPPTAAQLESLNAAASSGDLQQLQRLFRNALDSSEVEPFALANDASSRTGLTALHTGASRGYLEIVTWLIEECGAMPDLEDREGETALHKASLNGHLPIIKYLLPSKADVHAKDADGWTALHNASSKGYLDIVRWLCENGGAGGPQGVNVRSKDGWTPLMNASSKGHLPVVHYLLSKQSANPLIRNKWGETAYDTAAAVFEVWICQVLQQAEEERWRGSVIPYNPFAVHTTVPLVLYENQRLDTRLKTLAVTGGRPKFSASGLGRHGRRAPFELRLPVLDSDTDAQQVPAWRSDVQLPLRVTPWVLPKPEPHDRNHDGGERSHFWLSDWTLDVTHPGVDAVEGWQYARSFDDPDDQWTAEQSPQLERLLTGVNVVSVGLAGGSSSRASTRSNSTSSPSRNGQQAQANWVRRRRWVRIMRRRLDIPPLPFLEPDGSLYDLDNDGTLIPYVEEGATPGPSHDGGQELQSMSRINAPSARDYLGHAKYLVGTPSHSPDPAFSSPAELRRTIAKLERATSELRLGILGDDDIKRKTSAEVLLNTYDRQLGRQRLTAGAQGINLIREGDESEEEYDDDDEEGDEFRYPGAPFSNSPLATPVAESARPSLSRAPTDLTPHLSQAPDFRVPTHEAPQKMFVSRREQPAPHQLSPQWERDEAASNCRDCNRRFSFLLRRHHCRKCGRIFCDRCSSHRLLLDPADIVHDPAYPEPQATSSSQRVCQSCFDTINAGVPSRLAGARAASMERIFIEQSRLSVPTRIARRQSSSQLSDLQECPVCTTALDQIGGPHDQEMHVKACLEGNSTSPQSARYLVYRLPSESALLGTECVICLEEFTKGSTVARLSCLCSFHNTCLSSWLQRGKSCPVHAR